MAHVSPLLLPLSSNAPRNYASYSQWWRSSDMLVDQAGCKDPIADTSIGELPQEDSTWPMVGRVIVSMYGCLRVHWIAWGQSSISAMVNDEYSRQPHVSWKRSREVVKMDAVLSSIPSSFLQRRILSFRWFKMVSLTLFTLLGRYWSTADSWKCLWLSDWTGFLSYLVAPVVGQTQSTPGSVFILPLQGPSSNYTFAVNIPENSEDVYFHLSGPTEYSWIAVGTGNQMKDSLMIILYSNEHGDSM